METSNAVVAIIILALVAIVIWGIVVLLSSPLVQALLVIVALIAVIGALKQFTNE